MLKQLFVAALLISSAASAETSFKCVNQATGAMFKVDSAGASTSAGAFNLNQELRDVLQTQLAEDSFLLPGGSGYYKRDDQGLIFTASHKMPDGEILIQLTRVVYKMRLDYTLPSGQKANFYFNRGECPGMN